MRVAVFVAVKVAVEVDPTVLVKVSVAVFVAVFVGVEVEPTTVRQALLPPMVFQMLVTMELAVVGKPWPISHMPIPIAPEPTAQLILSQ